MKNVVVTAEKHKRSIADTHVLFVDSSAAFFSEALEEPDSNLTLAKSFLGMVPEAALVKESIRTELSPTRVLYNRLSTQPSFTALFQDQNLLEGEIFDFCSKYVLTNPAVSTTSEALLRPVPSEEIHRMQRSENWIGDFYSADLCVNILNQLGLGLSGNKAVFDFGCSSGSLLRVLAWQYPESKFAGSDPVPTSIEWAKSKLMHQNLRFETQGQEPPLSFPESSFDFVTAISIFSHFGINAARKWFAEMARVLKQGGHLICTIHGSGSLYHYMLQDLKPVVRYKELCTYFLANGYAFEEPWLGKDDAGNIATDAEWGNTFYSHSMIVALASEFFSCSYRGFRANQGNQDVYVFRRK